MTYDYRPKLNIDTLIFSLSDVLVDVHLSYHQVVQKTVQTYFEQALGLPKSKEPLLSTEDIFWLQRVGGFSNYWDLARAGIAYMVTLIPTVPVVTFPIRFHVPAMLAYLQMASARLKILPEDLARQKDVKTLAYKAMAAGGGLDGVYAVLPDKNRHLVVASGEITKINLVGRIFQELYLGASLFETIYQEPTVLVQSTGYIEHESLIIDRELLAQLQQKVALAVISNRPRYEVEHTLKARQIDSFFSVVVALEDMQKGKGKDLPDPWLLLEAARRMQPSPTQMAYVGSNPTDIKAARAAHQTISCTAAGCLVGALDRAALRTVLEESKASIILGHPNNLKELILD